VGSHPLWLSTFADVSIMGDNRRFVKSIRKIFGNSLVTAAWPPRGAGLVQLFQYIKDLI